MTESTVPLRIVAIRYEAQGVLSFVLRRPDGAPLPPIDPGAHVDLHLPNGLMRSYSLSNGLGDAGAYRLTIARDAKSSGGSIWLHDQLRVGQLLEVSAPRNNFTLATAAPYSVFIAGGIGVTPFLPMIVSLNMAGKPWRLHYCVRTRDRAALLEELEALAADGMGELVPNFDEEPNGAMLDLGAVLAGLPADAHVYCCGPGGMLDAFRAGAQAADIAEERVHFEYFSGDVAAATDGGYVVECRQSSKEVVVQPGQTILEALKAAGIDVPFSCEEGVCGACETRILSGVPDHRDLILSERERSEGKTMMVCCSGSKSERLVLDI